MPPQEGGQRGRGGKGEREGGKGGGRRKVVEEDEKAKCGGGVDVDVGVDDLGYNRDR